MIDQQTARCILEACQEETEWFTDLLMRLVMIETPPHEAESHRQLFKELAREFEDLDYKTEHYPADKSGGQLLARGTDEPEQGYQLLLGHIDTVWPFDTLKKMPVLHENGYISGPGSYDMKAGVTMMVTALKVLNKMELTPPIQPVFFINSDEETGSRESKGQIRKLVRTMCRTFVLEPSLGPEGKLKTRRKGIAHYEIHVKGRSSHAGLEPEKGRSAIVELSYLIQRLAEMNDPANGVTVNVGKIDGGISTNMVAPESTADVDVRVLTQKDARQIDQKINNLTPATDGVSLEIKGGFGRQPMMKNKRNRKLWNSAKQCGRLIGLQLDDATSGGASDGNLASQYTATLDGLGAVGEGAHSSNEKIYLDATIQRTALLTLLLMLPNQTDK